jgi:hypothetical protein
VQKWTTGVRRWVVVGGLLVFGLLSLWAQRAAGDGMTLSPLALAAQQPLALAQALIGCVLGGLVGGRFGYGVGRQLARPSGQRDLYAWWATWLWIWPWVLMVVMNLQAYQPSYGVPMAVEAWLIPLFPLTLGFKQSFPFALAAGYFAGTRAQQEAVS